MRERARPLPSPRGVRTAAAAALFAVLAAIAAPAFAAPTPESVKLVEEANRKLRQRDVAAALNLLQRAIAADKTNVDAHIRYQDLARDALGAASLQAPYSEAAKKTPDDPIVQFLAARLLPAQQAVEEFTKQSKTFAESPWPCAGLARALEDAGRAPEAATAHADALRRAGADAPRFLAYRAYGLERTGQWEAAAEAWKLALEKSPADLSAHYGLAESLRRSQQPDLSLGALEVAGKVGGSDAELAYRRGLVHLDVKKWDDSLAEFDKAIGLDKGMVEALCAASEAARQRAYAVADKEQRVLEPKDFERCVAYAERAVVAQADSPYAYYVLGAANEAQGELDAARLDDALKAYDAAIERLPIPGPDKVRALTARAWVLIAKGEGNFEAALETARKAIDIDRTSVLAYGHAGYAMAAMGKQKEAIDLFYKPGLKIDPECARLHHDLGMALWETKKQNDAKKSLETARDLEPENGRYRLSLGEIYYELKRNKEAVVELTKAAEVLPRDVLAWRALGRASYSAKNWGECVRGYEKVVELDSSSVNEHLILAVVYSEQMKDKAKAKAHATKFREKGGQDPNLDDWLTALLATETK